MRVWILTKREYIDTSYGNRRLREEADALGIELTFVCPEDCEILATKEGAKSFLYQGQPAQLPDCLIPRMGAGTTYFGLAVIRQMERLGVFVLNGSAGVEISKDKMATVQVLAEHDLPIPKTMLGKSPLDLDLVEREFSYPLVLKKLSGSQGRGVILCERRTQLRDMADMLEAPLNIILQEYVAKSFGKDIRIFMLGGRPLAAMLRKSEGESFKANVSAGGSVEPMELTPEIEWLAVESARVIGLEMAGVDILFDEEGYRVCEVNSSPGFKAFEPATGVNVAKEIFHYIQFRVERGREVSS